LNQGGKKELRKDQTKKGGKINRVRNAPIFSSPHPLNPEKTSMEALRRGAKKGKAKREWRDSIKEGRPGDGT